MSLRLKLKLGSIIKRAESSLYEPSNEQLGTFATLLLITWVLFFFFIGYITVPRWRFSSLENIEVEYVHSQLNYHTCPN